MASAVVDKLQKAGKALAGGLAGAVISVLFSTVTEPDAVVNPDHAPGASQVVQLPNTQAEWVTFVLAVVVGFGLPWLKKNYPSVLEAREMVKTAERRVTTGQQTQ